MILDNPPIKGTKIFFLSSESEGVSDIAINKEYMEYWKPDQGTSLSKVGIKPL